MSITLCALITSVALSVGVDTSILASKVMVESSGNPEAISHKGAVGLLQLTPIAVKDIQLNLKSLPPACSELFQKELNLYTPEINLTMGACYYKLLRGRMTRSQALASYNCGPSCGMGDPEKWPTETKNHVARVKERRSEVCADYLSSL
jgi:soluble lytic murein transglycosylase-like protein